MFIQSPIRQECLPEGFVATVDQYYRPLARKIAGWAADGPLVFGINGGQGTGKSTMALFLSHLLWEEHGLRAAILSIDDLYLTRPQRVELAACVHPLLATRGVPGTHDTALGIEVIDRLIQAHEGQTTQLPRFVKNLDDRMPDDQLPMFEGRADVVIFEGWCVGATPQEDEALAEPVNALERDEDPDGVWREYVNDQLKGSYRELFARIDRLVMLKAPDMACIRAWRGEQEGKLLSKLEVEGGDASEVMDGAALDRFVAHFQRLTEHQWRVMPAVAAAVLDLAQDHKITSIHWKGESS